MTDVERDALISQLEAQNTAVPIYVDQDFPSAGDVPSGGEALSRSDDEDAFGSYLASMNQRFLVHQLFSCMRMLQVVEQEDLLSVSKLLDDIHGALTGLYPSCPASVWDLQLTAPPLPKRFRKFLVDDEDENEQEEKGQDGDDNATCLCGDTVPDMVSCCISCQLPGHVRDNNACSTITSMITRVITIAASEGA
jgi:hypothetical protein